ncbi:hypothetical protein [Halobacterium litoreum]|uniref:Uncharacterized protein n=1 Tax=Halobacterium litoreum TaxID=2039234 RepID=A0ABD5NBW3_9EURY|nr:hypothetical protein [Halobacterium litoreum]UHH14638.1 hypothetical protein LT972_06465 [Halobacterium litoreum]
MSTPASDWWDVADDPDPERDLDYALIDLDVIQTTTNGRDQVLVLPTDEDLLREDAFMVAEESAVRDLEKMV